MIKKELNEVHFLRGAASFLVCLFHLCLGNEALFPSSNWIEQFFLSGYVGVEVFFVLSGYVICYAFPANSRNGNIGRFLLKRFTRVEPPYVVSILIVLALTAASHLITGLSTNIDYLSLAGHLFYFNNLSPNTYVNIVYWTLGIECQFYLLIAFLFSFLHRSGWHLFLILTSFFLLSCIPIPGTMALIFPYLSYFGLGILLSFFKQKIVTAPITAISACLFLLQVYYIQGFTGLVSVVLVSGILLFWHYTNKLIQFFSMISFSLYLIHVPVGGKLINLGMRIAHSVFSRYLLLFCALLISVLAAYVFYKLVEQPSLRIAKKIRYKPDSTAEKAKHIPEEFSESIPRPNVFVARASIVQEV